MKFARKSIYRIGILAAGLIMVAAFQNCSGGFESTSQLPSGGLGGPDPMQCRNPDTNALVNGGATYSYYTRQTGTTAECSSALVTTTCQSATGLFSPVPASTRYATCSGVTPPPPWNVPAISLTVGTSESFDLKTTLPAGIRSGGSFDLEVGSPGLPAGMGFDKQNGIISVGTAMVGSATGVIFVYNEP